MPTPKRVVLIVLRCIPVVVALGFLMFYVGRAQRQRNEMFSSSKNLRALSTAADQYFLEHPSQPAAEPPSPPTPPLPTLSPPLSTSPESALPNDIVNDAEATSDPFSIEIFPRRPATLSGSKSSVPVIEAPEFLRLRPPPPKTYHSYDLPPLRVLPHEITFGEPSVRVHTDAVAEPADLKFPPVPPATDAALKPQLPTPPKPAASETVPEPSPTPAQSVTPTSP